MQKEITYFTDDENIIKEFKRYKRVIKKKDNARIFLFEDEEEGYPDRKFISAEIQKPFPDGIIFITYADTIEDVLRNIEEFINY